MAQAERYRTLYEHEKDSTQKMLAMLDSVPEDQRTDPRFQQAVTLAHHLAACRENWLNFMDNQNRPRVAWWDTHARIDTLRPRFAAVQPLWTDYLARLTDTQLAQQFEFTESNGEQFHLPIGVQTEQLVGHAAYHRGQIALLVDQLGGETSDTDYADWWWQAQS